MSITIDQLFIGRVQPMLPEGGPTGIYKAAFAGRVMLTSSGLEGDEQGDLRHHGGPHKALHHYPVEHYALLVQEWPHCAGLAGAGVLGENISTRGLTEHDVCIGDIYLIGEARVQVSQPRSPCWKIDRRLGADKASRFVEAAGITGWYYRVLTPGTIAAGDRIELEERPNSWLSLAHYWDSITAHRPGPALFRRIAEAPGLAPDKAERCRDRAAWLEQNRA